MAPVKPTPSSRKKKSWTVVKDPRAVCELCPEKKPLCAAHIIPRYLLDLIPELEKGEWYDEKGRNVRRLCYNHHRLYDIRKLDLREHMVMFSHTNRVVNEFNGHIAQFLAAGIVVSESFFQQYDTFIKHSPLYDR